MKTTTALRKRTRAAEGPAALWAALLVLLVLTPVAPAHAGGYLTADEAYRRVQAGDVLLIDVRSPGEWRQTGLPKGAAAVTIHNPRGAQGFLDEILATVGGDKNKPIALICATGGRSSRARRFLEAQGFTDVYDVTEGMLGRGALPGWLARGLPTQPCCGD